MVSGSGKKGEKTGRLAEWEGGWRRQPYPSPRGGSRGWGTAPTFALAWQTLPRRPLPTGCGCKTSLSSPRALRRGSPSVSQGSPDPGTQDRGGALSGLGMVIPCLPFLCAINGLRATHSEHFALPRQGRGCSTSLNLREATETLSTQQAGQSRAVVPELASTCGPWTPPKWAQN